VVAAWNVVVMEEVKAECGAGVRAFVAPGRVGPPLVMCVAACLAVLAVAGHRTRGNDEALLVASLMQPAMDDAQGFEIARAFVRHTRGARADRQAGRPFPQSSGEQASTETHMRVAGGSLETGSDRHGVLAGVPEAVTAQLDHALGAATQQGGKLGVRLVYAETQATGEPNTHQLLAAQVRGLRYQRDVYYFQNRAGEAGFFDREGRSLGRDFLRYPVDFTRITSRFSERRFHPVLRRTRAHYGVDFAAPSGTPVRAIAKGVVTRAGWVGGNGRFVKIRHEDVYESGYAHLANITPGLRPGTVVEKGEIIGTVGASGLATGAHLHFALYRDGRYVDPLSVEPSDRYALKGRKLEAFKRSVAELEDVLDDGVAHPRGTIVTALLVN